MKKIFLFLLIGSLSSLLVQAQTAIESAQINFIFVSKDVEGTISGFRSDSSIDLQQIEASTLKGSVSVESLKTGNRLRDWSLKKSKYFNEDDYPRLSFESKSISKTGNGFAAEGIVTIKGISKPLIIKFIRKGDQLIGTTSLYSSDFNINIKSKREDNLVEIEMVFKIKAGV